MNNIYNINKYKYLVMAHMEVNTICIINTKEIHLKVL